MTRTTIYSKAADYLMEHGWRQHAKGEHGGPRCALGALFSASGMTDLSVAQSDETCHAYVEAVRQLTEHVDGNVPAWNNAPERTAEDVILAFKELANS